MIKLNKRLLKRNLKIIKNKKKLCNQLLKQNLKVNK